MRLCAPITVVLAATLLLANVAAAADGPGIPKDILKAMERYIGKWQFEGTEKDQPVRGSITYRWAPGKHCLLWDAVYTNPQGTFLGTATVAWDPAKKQLVERDFWPDGNWNTYTYTVKSNLWTGEAMHVHPNGETFHGTLTEEICSPEEYVWRLFEPSTSTGKPVEVSVLHFRKAPPATPGLFQEYGEAMVGEWRAEIVLTADLPGVGKKGEKVQCKSLITWLVDKQGLLIRLDSGGVSSHCVVVWDPESREIRSMRIDSLGAVFNGRTDKEGATWVCRFETTYPDGTKRSGKDTMSILDGGLTHTHAGSDVFFGDVKQPDYRDTWKRVTAARR
jgi:hypothetical protein